MRPRLSDRSQLTQMGEGRQMTAKDTITGQ